jgi:hypothetical protein
MIARDYFFSLIETFPTRGKMVVKTDRRPCLAVLLKRENHESITNLIMMGALTDRKRRRLRNDSLFMFREIYVKLIALYFS